MGVILKNDKNVTLPQGLTPFGQNQFQYKNRILKRKKVYVCDQNALSKQIDVLQFRKQQLPYVYGIMGYQICQQTQICGSQFILDVYIQKSWDTLNTLGTINKERGLSLLTNILRGYKNIILNCRTSFIINDKTIFFDQFNQVLVWIHQNPFQSQTLYRKTFYTPQKQNDMIQMVFQALEKHIEGGKFPLTLYSFMQGQLLAPLTFQDTVMCIQQYRRRSQFIYDHGLQTKRKILTKNITKRSY